MRRTPWGVGFVLLLAAGLGLGLWLGRDRGRSHAPQRTQEEWMQLLRSDDPEEGTRAWQDLADLGEEGLPVLLEAWQDPDVRLQRRAGLGLVRLGEPAVQPLLDARPSLRGRAEVVLPRMGKQAVPALQKALQDPEKAAGAARSLGAVGEPARDAVPALAALLLDARADADARVEAARALGEIGPEQPDAAVGDPVIVALTAALSGPEKVKREAARSLGAWGPAARSAVFGLMRLVKEKDAETARAACEALGRIRAVESAAALLWRMQQADDASLAAAEALGKLGPAAATAAEGLLESLKSDRADRRLALAVLERLGPTAAPDLEAALKAKDAVTRRAAASVLGLMGPRAATAAKALGAMLKQDDPAIVIAVSSALVRIEPDRTAPILAALGPLLTHKEDGVASSAAAVVGELGPDAAAVVPTLRKQLALKDEKAVSRAAAALGRIRAADVETIAALAAAAAKGPEPARPVCVRALGRSGEKSAVPALLPLLKDPALRGRAGAAIVRLDPAQGERVTAAMADDLAAEDATRKERALRDLEAMRPPPDAAVGLLLPLLGNEKDVHLACLALAECRAEALKPAVPVLITLLGSRDPATREAASVVLSRAGEAARPALEKAVRSDVAATRIMAIRALAGAQSRRKERPSVPAITAALADKEPAVQLAAAEALWRLQLKRDEAVARAALPLLAHPDAEVRTAAAWLVRDGPADLVEAALCECVLDPAEKVREAARSAPEASAGPRLAALIDLPARRRRERREAAQREADVRGERLLDRLEAARLLIEEKPERGKELFPFLLGVLEGWDESARAEAAETLMLLGKAARPALPALRRRLRRDDSDRVRRACEAAVEAIEEATPMSDENALLAALAEQPGDELTWLAYADWLEEQGGERHHFVRLLVRMAAGIDDGAERYGVRKLLANLHGRLDYPWCSGIARRREALPLRFRIEHLSADGRTLVGMLERGAVRLAQTVRIPTPAGPLVRQVERVDGQAHAGVFRIAGLSFIIALGFLDRLHAGIRPGGVVVAEPGRGP